MSEPLRHERDVGAAREQQRRVHVPQADDARSIADAETAAAPGRAWQQMFAETVENGVTGVAAKSALYRSDAAAYDLVASAEREIDAPAIGRMLQRLHADR